LTRERGSGGVGRREKGEGRREKKADQRIVGASSDN